MIKERRFVPTRILHVLLMLFGVYLLSIIYKIMYQTGIDELIAALFVSSLLFLAIAFMLVYNRVNGLLHHNVNEDYKLLSLVFLLSTALMFITVFLPDFCSFALLIGCMLCTVSNVQVGLTLSFALQITYCMSIHHNFYELACFLTLSLLGGVFVQAFSTAKYRLYVNVIAFSCCICAPCIFYFLANRKIVASIFLWGALSGLVSVLFLLLLYDKLQVTCEEKNHRRAEEIIRENFPLVQELRNFSKVNYEHAQKVSTLCYKCAKIADVDALTAAAAGFYYRVGRLEGEPFIQNGVELAQLNLFPESVITILAEYNGMQKLPSTPESAIVHLIDTLVLRFEHLHETASSSSWNREIIIYQTLNDTSASGIYDKSGLSINQFTKIKEFLVRGEDLK